MEYVLGTVQFGMEYGIQGAHRLSRELIYSIIDRAIEHGITVFDTASLYGDAEKILGEYLIQREDDGIHIKIVSKLASNVFDGCPKEQWKQIAIENISASLSRLNLTKLEAFLFHNASYIFDKDAVKALYSTVEKGLAYKVGVSVYTPQEALKALEYDEIGVIQIPYNLFDHRLDKCGFFERAREKKVKVYARSSLLQGLIMMDPDKLPARVRFAEKYIRTLRGICEEYNITPLEAAVSYAANHKGIDFIIFGVDSIEQLSGYIDMKSRPISAELEERLSAEFRDVEDKLVNPTLWR